MLSTVRCWERLECFHYFREFLCVLCQFYLVWNIPSPRRNSVGYNLNAMELYGESQTIFILSTGFFFFIVAAAFGGGVRQGS